ncbi:hypothetical protein RJT34_23763 [Clitoria ternatea]|uniref:Late embryogenesis abundant protein LEA-2 subgroup domain-containing protein n=1 Tax=Clitoria ternatea TaxID=43366 RepID=A0AAN9FLP9_CLITE
MTTRSQTRTQKNTALRSFIYSHHNPSFATKTETHSLHHHNSQYMADNKEPQSNNNHRGRGCCCCLFRTFWILLVSIIVFALLVILVAYIIIQPRSFKFHVTNAKLTRFNYTGNTLNYNLVLNFTERNPNKKLNIYYDLVEGHAFYEGVRFASGHVIPWQESFRQFAKSTNTTSAVFSGQHVMVLDHQQVSEFDEDKRNGVFRIDLKLYFTIRFRLGDFIGGDMKPKAKCKLEVPSVSNGSTVSAFSPTNCEVDF